ncbi:hypothetical protein GGI26_006345 [Coemansia sp. RSA 1358]|uniref:Uncharacterized protein n=1 Tax=Coemansia umbellata TaxID=1424467 RepID=A0ABQ8PCK1_9FUNG|nr:hypothetical protein EDC05_006521 [Coemansia umbellata]KAJ2618801.1 hypothetical protein GGI26_006345 [Coemansia sp. RSA 1358]
MQIKKAAIRYLVLNVITVAIVAQNSAASNINWFSTVVELARANTIAEYIGFVITDYLNLHHCAISTTSSGYEFSATSGDYGAAITSDIYEDTTTSGSYEATTTSDTYQDTTSFDDYAASSTLQYRSTVTVITNKCLVAFSYADTTITKS